MGGKYSSFLPTMGQSCDAFHTVSALGVRSGKLFVDPSLLISSFPFLTSACLTVLLGSTLKSSLRVLLNHGAKRMCLIELMFFLQDHTPGVKKPRILYSDGFQMLLEPVQDTLSIESNFLRADYVLLCLPLGPKFGMNLECRLIVQTHLHVLLS